MALVPDTLWSATYLFRDNNDNRATVSVSFPGLLAYAAVVTAAGELANVMRDVSDAILTGYHISRFFYEDQPQSAATTSEVERKLVMNMGTARRRNASSIEIPSPIFALEQAGSDDVDLANAAYQALVVQLTRGLIGPGNGLVTSSGEDITRVDRGYVSHRYRRRKS